MSSNPVEAGNAVPTPSDVVEGSAAPASQDGQDVQMGEGSESDVPPPPPVEPEAGGGDAGDAAEAVAERDAAEEREKDGEAAQPSDDDDEDDDDPEARIEKEEASSADDPSDSESETEARRSKKKGKKSKKSKSKAKEKEQDSAEDEPELTGAEKSQARINAQIEAALKVGKKKTKKRKAGEVDLETLGDEEVQRLREEMIAAADADQDANENRKPATEKLKLLTQVVSTLQKTHLQQAILDNNLLEGVRRWLEPLPDRSLPALNIQRQLFAILGRLPIDEITLKMSGLGKVVLFYSMCKRTDPAIKRAAEKLIEIWSRPILKRSASYRTRAIETKELRDLDRGEDMYEIQSQVDSNRRHVAMPQAVKAGYTIAPRAVSGLSGQEESHQARLANHKRLNDFKGKLKSAKR